MACVDTYTLTPTHLQVLRNCIWLMLTVILHNLYLKFISFLNYLICILLLVKMNSSDDNGNQFLMDMIASGVQAKNKPVLPAIRAYTSICLVRELRMMLIKSKKKSRMMLINKPIMYISNISFFNICIYIYT